MIFKVVNFIDVDVDSIVNRVKTRHDSIEDAIREEISSWNDYDMYLAASAEDQIEQAVRERVKMTGSHIS